MATDPPSPPIPPAPPPPSSLKSKPTFPKVASRKGLNSKVKLEGRGQGKGAKNRRFTPNPISTALTKLEKVAGGRSQLATTISSASESLTPQEDVFIRMMADARYARYSLARICSIAGLSMGGVLKLFQKGKGAEALVSSLNHIYDKLPQVAADVTLRALPHKAVCTSCNGTKNQWKDGRITRLPCPDCFGSGKIDKDPDLERQKIALTIGGLLKPSGGVNVTQNNQQQVAVVDQGPLRTTVEFREAVTRLLYPGRPRVPSTSQLPLDPLDVTPPTPLPGAADTMEEES